MKHTNKLNSEWIEPVLIQDTIADARNDLVNIALIASSFFSLPTLFMMIIRALDTGWQPIFIISLIVVPSIILCAIFRDRLLFRFKAGVFVGVLLIVGTGCLLDWGVIGLGTETFILCAVFTTLLFGFRIGMIIFILEIVVISIIAINVYLENITYNFDFNTYAVSSVSWFLTISMTALICGLTLVLMGRFYKILISAYQNMDNRSHALEKSNERLMQLIERHKEVEAELIREKEFSEKVISNLPGTFNMVDEHGKYFRFNKQFIKASGYSADEILTMRPRDFLPERLKESGLNLLKKHFEKGIIDFEISLVTKAGEEIPYHYNGSTIAMEGGKFALVVGMDISERKKQEYRLRQLAAAIDNIAETVIITDTEGKIRYVNPAFERLLGYGMKDIAGETPAILKSDMHEDSFFKSMWKTIESGQTWTGLVFNKTRENMIVDHETTISPIRNSKNEIIEYVGILRDVTEKRKLEQQFMQSQKMEAIGTLAGGIAHDFNNILGVIIGQSELISLFDIDDKSPTHKRINHILKASERARQLVKQILTISRQSTLIKQPVDIVPLIKEVTEFIRASAPASIEIRQNISINKAVVLSDSGQIHQILMNLCTNAIQAMASNAGTLDIELAITELDENTIGQYQNITSGTYVMVVVSDTGPGMSTEIQEKIFEPYFTTKEEGKGTGLGLAVVQGIVQNYNGNISVYSEEGEGSTFRVLLPLNLEDEFKPASVSNNMIPRGSESILLVDDDARLLKTCYSILQNLGYNVTAHNSSRKAFETFKANPDQFDLLITDYTMPKQTGVDLYRKLKYIRPDVPAILCSGFGKGLTNETVTAEGFKAFLAKPLETGLLARTIRSVLGE